MTTLGQASWARHSVSATAPDLSRCSKWSSWKWQWHGNIKLTVTWKHQVGNNMETWKHHVGNNMETSQESSIHSLALKSPISSSMSNFTVCFLLTSQCFLLTSQCFLLTSQCVVLTSQCFVSNLNGVFSFDGLAAISEKLSKHFFCGGSESWEGSCLTSNVFKQS